MVGMYSVSTRPSLLEALRGGGNERVWAEFCGRYDAMLISFAKKLGLGDADAADAVQETLLAVYNKFRLMNEPFDLSRGRFQSWLRGIVKHKVLDVLASKGKAKLAQTAWSGADGVPCFGVDLVPDERSSNEADELFEAEWRLNQVAQALELVKRESDPGVYQAFFLTFIEKQDPTQVAKLLGVSRGAVYVSKCKTLKKVRAAVLQIQRDEE